MAFIPFRNWFAKKHLARPAPTSTTAKRLVSYDGTSTKKEKVRLRRLATELKKDDYVVKYGVGYIMSYGGRRTYPREVLKRADQTKRYLVEKEGINPDRIITKDGGYKENWVVELWIVPMGAISPTPDPTINDPYTGGG